MAPPPQAHLVWAVDGNNGREEHMAELLRQDGDKTVLIKWSSTGSIVTLDSSCIKRVVEAGRPSRTRKASHETETSTPVKRVKKENDVKPTTPTVQAPISSPAAVAGLVSPDGSTMSEYATIARVKKEDVDNVFSDERTISPEREALKKKMVKALTDPKTNGPRAVFRRGCSRLSNISTVLGGTGTDCCPFVKRPPGGDANIFMEANETYIAGHCDWNPWAPRFPGDNGLVDASFVSGKRGNQDEYHMFTSCAERKADIHYHGKDAKTKYLYLGKYSTPEKGSDDDICEVLQFKNLPRRLQWFRAEYFHRKTHAKEEGFELEWRDPITGFMQRVCEDDVTQAHMDQAKQEYQDEVSMIAESKWEDLKDSKRAKLAGGLEEYKAVEIEDAMSKWQKQYDNRTWYKKDMIAAWVVMLVEKDYVIELIPVKFESYDESLYEELVSIGATNGHVTLGAAIV